MEESAEDGVRVGDLEVPGVGAAAVIHHLRPLHEFLTARAEEAVGPNGWNPDTLPYTLAKAEHCLGALVREVRSLAEQITVTRQPTVVPKAAAYACAFPIDSFLDAATRSQNALLSYIDGSLDLRSQPMSMAARMAAPRWLRLMPEPIAQMLSMYWDNNGRRLREYRDLSQQNGSIISEVVLSRTEVGVSLALHLPNNPENRSRAAWKYRNPVVHALPYVRAEYSALLRLVYATTLPLTPSGQRNGGGSEVVRAAQEILEGDAITLPEADYVTASIEELVKWLSQKPSATAAHR